jgi:hypothetical protein
MDNGQLVHAVSAKAMHASLCLRDEEAVRSNTTTMTRSEYGATVDSPGPRPFMALACKMREQRSVQPRSRSQTASGHAGRLACGLLHDDGVGVETMHDRPTCSWRVWDDSTRDEQGDDYRVRRDGIV